MKFLKASYKGCLSSYENFRLPFVNIMKGIKFVKWKIVNPLVPFFFEFHFDIFSIIELNDMTLLLLILI